MLTEKELDDTSALYTLSAMVPNIRAEFENLVGLPSEDEFPDDLLKYWAHGRVNESTTVREVVMGVVDSCLRAMLARKQGKPAKHDIKGFGERKARLESAALERHREAMLAEKKLGLNESGMREEIKLTRERRRLEDAEMVRRYMEAQEETP